MADKKIIQEAIKKGVFESSVGDKLKIAGAQLKPEERGFEITVGKDAREALQQLGFSENTNGVMAIPAHDTIKKEKVEETSR